MYNLKDKINEVKIINPDEKVKYRLSNTYFFRSFVLAGIIMFTIFYVGKDILSSEFSKDYVYLIIVLGLFVYIIFHLYTVFKFKIIVDKNNIIDKNNKLLVKDITKLSIRVMKISNKINENCLVITTKDNKEYVYRLNINNKFKFIKQISLLSNNEVIIEG
ncbi:hypothetical protein STFE110948_00765 [Streptobacillus felis]|uniref:hypothetical protein n=1 Tax=Streptobacillus felis TaxID=1384509 RepID=UPI0039E94250